jgi:hypothetical protein
LMVLESPGNRGVTGLRPSRVDRKDMLSTPFVAGRGRADLSSIGVGEPRTNLSAPRGAERMAKGQASSSSEGGRGIEQKSGGEA